jgi:energy-coupling factor transporter transmembrane protein EcfT
MKYKNDWEVTINDILIFVLDCLTIVFMVVEEIGKWVLPVLKYVLYLVLIGLFLFGMFKGCEYLYHKLYQI